MTDWAEILKLCIASAAGGTLGMFIKATMDKHKTKAETKKLSAESEGLIVQVALRMAEKLESSVKILEEKTENLSNKNVKLEHELAEIRLSNISMVREMEVLKKQNDGLSQTCDILIRENTSLKVELDNCIKIKKEE